MWSPAGSDHHDAGLLLDIKKDNFKGLLLTHERKQTHTQATCSIPKDSTSVFLLRDTCAVNTWSVPSDPGQEQSSSWNGRARGLQTDILK